MSSIFQIPLASFLLGLIGIPIYIFLAKKLNIIDTPNQRSSHKIPTPRGGGVFLAFGSILLAGVLEFFSPLSANGVVFLMACLGIALLGLVDDLSPLPSIPRLGIQIILATTLFCYLSSNLPFDVFSLRPATDSPLIWLIGACSIIWIVGCLNIYNFMDGIDGIATLQGIAAAATWAIISYDGQSEFSLSFSLLLMGGLIAFLLFNWSPAKVFMGDCASGFLGFSFAALPLVFSAFSGYDSWKAINLSALMLFPFLFDGTFTLGRRAYIIIRSKAIHASLFSIHNLARLRELTQAHRSHLYQRWTQAGSSHGLVASAYGIWAAIGSVAAVMLFNNSVGYASAYGLVTVPALVLLVYSKRFPE